MFEKSLSFLFDSQSDSSRTVSLLSAFDAMSPYIFFLDCWGVVRHGNVSARRWQDFALLEGNNLVESAFDISDAWDNHREVLQVARTGVAMRGRKIHINIDGRDAWFSVDKIPLNNAAKGVAGVLLIFDDITSLVTTRRSLSESEAKYKAFIENSSDAIWCYDLHPPVNTELPCVNQVEQILWRSTLSECNDQLARFVGVESTEELLDRPVPRNGSLANRHDVEHFVKNQYIIERQELLKVDRFGNRRYLMVSAKGIVKNGFLARVWGTTRDTTEHRRYLEKMEYLANHDALTNLPNRSLLYNRVEAAISQRNQDQKMALLIIDLDRFKEINDTFGHLVGDKVLKQLGPRLECELGETTGLVARLGGDEFAIFLPNIRNAQQAVVMGHRLLDCVGNVFDIEGVHTEIHASIGVALCPDQAEDVSTLMRYADVAMYHAKNELKGVAIYDAEFDAHSPKRLEIMGALGRAIREDQFEVYYQPKVDVGQHRIYGVEALLRWAHPSLGLLPPGEFIPTAEKSSVIYPMTRWVLESAIRQGAQWWAEGLSLVVAVNLSARNLLDDTLVDDVAELIDIYCLPANLLELEITESAIMRDQARAMTALERLSGLNVKLSIDDYGTGYSSLAYLKKLPVQALKIDSSFVLDMVDDPQDEIIVSSTIQLAHNLGLKVVAEGVENAEIYKRLVLNGCDCAQGYYIAKPMPIADFQAWIQHSDWYRATKRPPT